MAPMRVPPPAPRSQSLVTNANALVWGWTTKASTGKTDGARTGKLGPSFRRASSSATRSGKARTTAKETASTEDEYLRDV